IVDRMEPGDLSGVIRQPFGCNLMQLVDRRPYERITYDEVRDQLRGRLFSERMSEKYTEFIQELREQTYIERRGIFAEAARLDPGQAARRGGPAEPPGTF
ncbi:MAG: hypothetical protein R3263_09510, partial [Myxococcota bacterium]|nr:hypothetical protein [Myxococcota bacterium]